MRIVLQRVSRASVSVADEVVGKIDQGFVALVGVEEGDAEAQADLLAAKVVGLRVFDDDAGKFNLALADVDGAVLVISQFTLISDLRKGRRPAFTRAARPDIAAPLVERFAAQLSAAGVDVAGGRFGEHMIVDLTNDGPVTIVIDSAELERPRRQS